MAFKETLDLDCDSTTAIGGVDKKSKKANPKSIEGYYLGSKKVKSDRAKNGFAYLHILQTKNGNTGVWGKTNMDQKMLGVTPGLMVRITHTGMVPTPNGDMYKYKVEIDDENTIEVAAPAASDEGYEGEEGSDFSDSQDFSGDETEESDPGEDEPALDEVPPQRAQRPRQAAATPSVDRQNKVKSLLGGRKANA